MNRDPILFRVDGTAAKGWERLARTMSLASALQRRRRPTYFLAQLEPTSMAFTMKRSGMEWLDADAPAGTEEDLSEVVQEVRRLRPAAVIVDAPEASEEYLRAIERAGAPVISIDHHASARFPSRLVINPLLGPGRDGYSVDSGAQLLLGARYAIVRPEIRRARPARAQEQPAPIRALVALGDDDPHRQTLPLTKQLLGMPKIERVDMLVRPQHPDLEVLKEFAAAQEDRVTVASEGADITSRIARCHFAVSAGAALSLELACVGVPQLLIVQNESALANGSTPRGGRRRHLPGLARKRFGPDHPPGRAEPGSRPLRTAGHEPVRPATHRRSRTRPTGHGPGGDSAPFAPGPLREGGLVASSV